MAKKKIKVPKVENGVPVGEVEIEVDDSAGPSWGANDQHRLLNKPMVRVDGPAKATGAAVYTHDVKPPGMLFGRFVTSPGAHAKISKLDFAAAQKMNGVKAVMTVVGVGGEVRIGQDRHAAGGTVDDDPVHGFVVHRRRDADFHRLGPASAAASR